MIPSVGLPKHAAKVACWGADAVMIQGGEGGGHTGSVPTARCCLPDASCDAGRTSRSSRPAASSTAAASPPRWRTAPPGIGMGTRFLLTADSAVPEAVKRLYLAHDLNGTVVTDKVDGMPHRMLRTPLVEEIEESSRLRRLAPTLRRTLEFKRDSGMSWRELAVDGRAMRKAQGRSLAQMALAANTPTMLKAGLVDGDTDAGVLAAGQVVGRARRPAELRGADRPGRHARQRRSACRQSRSMIVTLA